MESGDGRDADTFRDGYFGGIWQVDEDRFLGTQDVQSNPGKIGEINNRFGIQWGSSTWEDLLKPLYSALAACLFLTNVTEPIPDLIDIQGQAEYWKMYYDTAEGKGTVAGFIDSVESLRLQISSGECD